MTERRMLGLAGLFLVACVDAGARSESTIDSARIIAVVADPAESPPGAQVHFRAYVASPSGPLDVPLGWSFCSTPRAATENTAASPACVLNAEQPIAQTGTSVDAVVPSDACMRFGSEAPSGRAANAVDGSGGYYQPLRVALSPAVITLVRQRIRCALPNAPLAAAREYNRDYLPNRAPSIAAIRVFGPQGEVQTSSLPHVDPLVLQVEVAPDARESYLLYDSHSRRLATSTEQLSVSWYVSSGFVEQPAQELVGNTAQGRWYAPAADVNAWLWVVLRDDRGGMAAEARELLRAWAAHER